MVFTMALPQRGQCGSAIKLSLQCHGKWSMMDVTAATRAEETPMMSQQALIASAIEL